MVSAIFEAPDLLSISGSGFGSLPHVFINEQDVSQLIVESSDTSIQLIGKAKKLNLKKDKNRIQLLTIGKGETNVFILVR
jgi:hypothetical protein